MEGQAAVNVATSRRFTRWELSHAAISSRASYFTLAVFVCFYFVSSLYIAARRLFWYDEIVTVRVASLPAVTMIWDSLMHGADGNPPGFFLLARAASKLPVASEIGFRLPSALALAATLLLTFDAARRLSNQTYGLIAAALLSSTILPYYGYEARPYAAYCMLSALSLWTWISYKDTDRKGTVIFGLTLFCAVAVHYYAVVLLVPYALWELCQWRPGHRPSPKLWAGIGGALLAMGILSRLMFSYATQFIASFVTTPWAPSLTSLRGLWIELFPNGLFLLVLLCLVLWRPNAQPVMTPRFSEGEAIGWLFLCIPLAGFFIATIKTNAFLPRYFISMLPGVAIAFSACLWRNFRTSKAASVSIFLVLAAGGLVQELSAIRHPDEVGRYGQQSKVRNYLELQAELQNEGKSYLVFSSSILHLELSQYASNPARCVLLLPTDPSRRTIQNRMELNLTRDAPITVWDLDDLRRHAAEAALLEPREDFLQELRQDGFQLVEREPKPKEVIYIY
jgi:hypothetical protein